MLKKLLQIQQKLKVQRTRVNDFIKGFKYWNVEDILENVKPILAEQGCVLTMSDSVESFGGLIFVRARVTLTDTESGETVSAEGWAGWENKKGIDAAQSTGVSSTYARKYALNGLFAINDTKDSDELPPDSIQNGDMRPPQYSRPKPDPNAKFGGMTKDDYDRMVDMAAHGVPAKNGQQMRDWYRDVYGASPVQVKLFEASVAERRTAMEKEEGDRAALDLGLTPPKAQPAPTQAPAPKPAPAPAKQADDDDEDLPF